MYSFRPEELFRVNEALRYRLYSMPAEAGSFVIVDDFYADPVAVRRLLLTTPYPVWDRDVSGANLVEYSDCRQGFQLSFNEPQDAIRALCAQTLDVRLPRNRTSFVSNLFRSHTEPPSGAQPRPHDDGICIAAIVMLNTPEECAGGTAFYRSRAPALTCMPIQADEYRARRGQVYTGTRNEVGAGYFLDGWEQYWERVATVEMRFNRLLIYPGVLFHGHWHAPGSFVDCWRVNQAMFFEEPAFGAAYSGISRAY
jgi:hypothetical protein